MNDLLKLIQDGAELSVIEAKAKDVSKTYEEMAYKVENGVIDLAKQKEATEKFRETNIKLAKAYKSAFGDEIDFQNFDADKFVADVQEKMKTGDKTLDALNEKYKEEAESNKALIAKLNEEKSKLEQNTEQMKKNFIIETSVSDAINSLPVKFIDPTLGDTFKQILLQDIEVKDGKVIPMELRDGTRIPMFKDGKQLDMRDFALIKSEEKAVFFEKTSSRGDGGAGGAGGSFKGKNYEDMTPSEKYDYIEANKE